MKKSFLEQYIDAIESGEIIVGNYVKKLYLGQIKPILHEKSSRWTFNEKKGVALINFAEAYVRQSKGGPKYAGKLIQYCLFQKAKWEAIYGIVDRKTGIRKYTEVLDMEGRKNGKTTDKVPVVIYELIKNPGASLYSCAATSKQAKILYTACASAISQEPLLGKLLHPVENTGHIDTRPQKGRVLSTFDTLPKNYKALDGLNTSLAFIDEIHTLPRDIYDLMVQSQSMQQEPLLIMSTTDGFLRGGLLDDKQEYGMKVLDGVIEDEKFFALLYLLDDPENEKDNPMMWIKVNPSLGQIKSMEFMQHTHDVALHDLNQMSTFITKDLNIHGVDKNAWLDGLTIIKGDYGPYTPEEVGMAGSPEQEEFIKRFDGQIVVGGYDLSKIGDLTSFTTLLFDATNKTIIAKTMYWTTREFLCSPEARESKVPLQAWIDRGLLRISGDNQIDYHDIANYVIDQINTHKYIYQFIGYDSWSAAYLVTELESLGFAKTYCQIPIIQGFKTLSQPMEHFEALLKEKRICYLHNPITKWCISNVEMVTDRNGNLMPKKVNDNRANKIDGFATILNAIAVHDSNNGLFDYQEPAREQKK